jgi:hypothetical protein
MMDGVGAGDERGIPFFQQEPKSGLMSSFRFSVAMQNK